MSRAARISNLLAVTIPFVAFIAAVVLLWDRGVGWHDLALFGVFYLLTSFGVTVGFHRLFTHRSFATKPWMRGIFAAMGSMAIEGPVISWVADHRKHHAFTDVEGDPHSPHAHGEGIVATINSDDPAYFGGYVGDNYVGTAEALGLTRDDMIKALREHGRFSGERLLRRRDNAHPGFGD